MALIDFVKNLTSIYRPTCISNKFAHQVESHALQHCLELTYWHYQLVLTWYLHQPESHQLSFKNVSYLHTSGPIDRTPGTPGSDKNCLDGNVTNVSDQSFPCRFYFLDEGCCQIKIEEGVKFIPNVFNFLPQTVLRFQ